MPKGSPIPKAINPKNFIIIIIASPKNDNIPKVPELLGILHSELKAEMLVLLGVKEVASPQTFKFELTEKSKIPNPDKANDIRVKAE